MDLVSVKTHRPLRFCALHQRSGLSEPCAPIFISGLHGDLEAPNPCKQMAVSFFWEPVLGVVGKGRQQLHVL